MPSPRYTDHGPAARLCPRCGATHRTHTSGGQPILCPPVDRWLISRPTRPPREHVRRGEDPRIQGKAIKAYVGGAR